MDKKKQQIIIGTIIVIVVLLVIWSVSSHEPRGIDNVTDTASGTFDPYEGPNPDPNGINYDKRAVERQEDD